MGGSIRLLRVAPAPLVLVTVCGAFTPRNGFADDRQPEPPKTSVRAGDAGQAKSGAPAQDRTQSTEWRSELAKFFGQPGDEPPRPFIPLRPATVDDRRRIEALRLYSTARALEDQHDWAGAIALLQEASKLDPDSVAIARRLCRIYIGAQSRPDLALQYGRRVLALEPGDTETLGRLVDYYNAPQRNDSAGAESLLKEVLANPKLDTHSPGRLLAEFELGKLYSTRLKQLDKAADSFAKVIVALDDKAASRLSPSDVTRVLGNDPATAYLNFGLIFLAAKRDDQAVTALEHGLVYDEDNSQIALVLAETLLRLKKGDQALLLVDRAIRRQPQGVEAYELLAKVLTALGRAKEITPRLEEAAQRDSKNVPLQYVLADRYRETGHVEKAEALYNALLSSQPTPQTYRALAASLLKRRKGADLLKVICDAVNRPSSQEAIRPQLVAAAADDGIALDMLDAGLRMLSENPPKLSARTAFQVLAIIANADRGAANKVPRLEKLLKLQRLQLEQAPDPLVYSQIADTERRLGKFAEAAATVEQLIAKYPAEKSVRTLAILAGLHHRSGHNEAARATLRDAVKLNEPDAEAQVQLATALSEIGQVDEAVRILRELSKREPKNPVYDLTLGSMLTRFGRNDDAIKLFEDMLQRHADNDEMVRVVRPMLSSIYVTMGNFSKGEAELELLLQRNPDEPGPNNDLGYLYAEQGKNLDKAESMVRKALQEEPDNYAYLDSMGWVLFKQGKLKEALEKMMRAAERMRSEVERLGNNPDPTILEHLGDVYFQLQEVDKAEGSWRQALKAADEAVPPDRRRSEIRKKLDTIQKLGHTPRSSPSRTP
jgi:tetratricopeptide (TPR) repeat protein